MALSSLLVRPGGSSRTSPSALIWPVRKTIDEMWPSPIAQAHQKADGPGRDAVLHDSRYDRRVEKSHRFDGILHREAGADQEHSSVGRFREGWDERANLLVILGEYLTKIRMPIVKITFELGQKLLDFRFGKRLDPLDDLHDPLHVAGPE